MNSLFVIAPYKYEGMWVFDDPAVGLSKEPFIAGIDTMIDKIVAGFPVPIKVFVQSSVPRNFPGPILNWNGAAKNPAAIGIAATNPKWKGGSARHS
jgi:hypothetical protein